MMVKTRHDGYKTVSDKAKRKDNDGKPVTTELERKRQKQHGREICRTVEGLLRRRRRREEGYEVVSSTPSLQRFARRIAR